MAEPRSTARTVRPSRWASDSRIRTNRPAPSAQPVPSASSENGLQRPSAASPLCEVNAMNGWGVAMTDAPPARAMEHSPPLSAWTARCRETSDEEQPVSTVTAGPSAPRK
ncbi:hypothetical protein TNCT6_08040 [Streptomyces sp. 6-11-2]|nr:hypothetical protein TNCT6_08040 [Streptomyces sp. 6-11-2]